MRLAEYTEEAQQAIRAEMERRALTAAESIAPDSVGEEQQDTPAGYFSRLWHGEIPLVQTYWMFGVAGSIVWRVLAAIVASNPIALFSVAVCELGYRVVAWTAIWRSAGRYRGRRAWAEMARVSVTFGIVVTVISVLSVLFPDGH